MRLKIGLCQGRHSMPVDNFVFDTEVNPTDTKTLEAAANAAIAEEVTEVDLYVTGLTVAFAAVVKVCTDRGIGLTAYHYDRESGEYYPQTVISTSVCPFCGTHYVGRAWYCPGCGAT